MKRSAADPANAVSAALRRALVATSDVAHHRADVVAGARVQPEVDERPRGIRDVACGQHSRDLRLRHVVGQAIAAQQPAIALAALAFQDGDRVVLPAAERGGDQIAMRVGCRIRRPHDPAVDEELHERVVARLAREHAVAEQVGARVTRMGEDEPARRRAEQPGEGRRHALERSVALHMGAQIPVGDAQARGEHLPCPARPTGRQRADGRTRPRRDLPRVLRRRRRRHRRPRPAVNAAS